MKMSSILTVYFKELKDSFRDRRALISIIVIPTLLMPMMMFGVLRVAIKVSDKAREEIPTVMIVGGEDSPGVVAALQASKKVKVVPRENKTQDQIESDISEKRIRAAVKIPEKFEAGLANGIASEVLIYHYQGEVRSSVGASALEKFFQDLRTSTVEQRLAERSLPASLIKPFDYRRQNVAPAEKVTGSTIGGFIPYLIIILCFTGAMYPAMDLTAGEKERGTMETLLCSPVSRVDIVLGKFLMVLTGSLMAMSCSLISMGVSAALSGPVLFGGKTAMPSAAATMIPMVNPLGMIGVLAMVFPVAVLFAAGTFTIALFAKSQKEAQSYLAPLIIVVILPAAIGMLPGIDLDARLSLVPLLNLSLVCREMLSGVWHWNYIAIIFLSSCVYAAIALWLAVRMFKREDVIFRT